MPSASVEAVSRCSAAAIGRGYTSVSHCCGGDSMEISRGNPAFLIDATGLGDLH
jgi:hypothetical protein